MDVVSKITFFEDITVISIHNAPSKPAFIADVLRKVADAGVDVDMINQSAPHGGTISLSFTIPDAALAKVLSAVATFKDVDENLSIKASPGNCKLSFFGTDMPGHPGTAASVFSIFAEANISPKLITTSTVDISVLVEAHFAHDLQRIFEVRMGAGLFE